MNKFKVAFALVAVLVLLTAPAYAADEIGAQHAENIAASLEGAREANGRLAVAT